MLVNYWAKETVIIW